MLFDVLRKIPPYAYLAGAIAGVTASYLFYTPSYSKSKSKNAKLNGYPRGLINHNNECFINVILQSLSSSNKTIEWLLNSTRSTPVLSNSKATTLFDTLSKIIVRINRLEINKDKENDDFDEEQLEFYAAHSVKRALNSHNWQIQSEEHDCHELFHLVMDCLNEEQLENDASLKSLNYFMPSNLRESSRISHKNPYHGYFLTQLGLF
jgi:ubiquitin carboxyl-terminal hydrolase 30